MGMFLRRCRVEYALLPFDRLADIREAFHQYILGQSGDSQFLTQEQSTWVSVYNVKEFLKSQAEKIERNNPPFKKSRSNTKKQFIFQVREQVIFIPLYSTIT